MYKFAAIVIAIIFTTPALSDEVTDANRMLCASGPVSHCVEGIGCNSADPEDENIPEFIEVDLKRKTLAATQASGMERSTSIQHQSQSEGNIYLQGLENGRLYSLVIAQISGDLSFTVTANGETATMFGSCTPD
jgi:hypothetical protein